MLSVIILALCAFQLQIVRGSVSVSTAPFDLVDQQLQVAFNDTLINPPGLTIPLTVPLSTPTIGLTSAPTKDTYLLIMVDPNSATPDVLHWFQTNLTLSTSNVTVGSLSFHPLLSTTAPLAPYVKPNPPQGSGPHRYTELLFLQPAGFSIPANYARFIVPTLNRTGFNLTTFVKDAGLPQPIAGNYFFAENRTATANQTTSTGSASRTGTAAANQTSLTGSTTRTGTAAANQTALTGTGSGTGSRTGTAAANQTALTGSASRTGTATASQNALTGSASRTGTATANQTASRTGTTGGAQGTGTTQFKGDATHITSSALIGATALQAFWIMVHMLV